MKAKTVFHLRNTLLLLGVVITITGLIYFATQFIDRLSEWGRFLAVALMAVVFVSLGRHFEAGAESTELVGARGWRWLRVTTVLYVLGLVATFTAVILFFAIDSLDRLIKAGVAVVGGLVVILLTARHFED